MVFPTKVWGIAVQFQSNDLDPTLIIVIGNEKTMQKEVPLHIGTTDICHLP